MDRELFVIAVAKVLSDEYYKLALSIEAATKMLTRFGVPDPKAVIDKALAQLSRSLDMQEKLTKALEKDGLDPIKEFKKLNDDPKYATELLRKYDLITEDEAVCFSEVKETEHE